MRDDRRHNNAKKPMSIDGRSPSQRDRDRILYSAEFRRLAGITQTAASDTEHTLHNRLTHVLGVAQIGRRLAEKLNQQEPKKVSAVGGIDPEVVESACLAHDLGHPPFGHIAEKVLNQQAAAVGARGGFEGNAQSFRIVTKLAEHKVGTSGLDLTRATLNAILKYPWPRGNDGKEKDKWGFYSTEEDDFQFARALGPSGKRRCAEADLMNWADDIAYSVHDMLDFHQAGLIPLGLLAREKDDEKGEFSRFINGVFTSWLEHGIHSGEDTSAYEAAFREFVALFFEGLRTYEGLSDQRHDLKALSSVLIERYVNAVTLQESPAGVDFDKEKVREVTMLKELTWHYVIRNPALASQQHGQRKIIEDLFRTYYEACKDRRRWHLFPPRCHEIAQRDSVDKTDNDEPRSRFVCDLIAGMSEQQAVAMYHRLNGITPGSAFTSIIR